jgi:hypothetical protein
MHETTVYPTVVVLQHVNSNSSQGYKVHPKAFGTVLQYQVAVFAHACPAYAMTRPRYCSFEQLKAVCS